MSRPDSRDRTEPHLDAVFVPPDVEGNAYLDALASGLEGERVTVRRGSWSALLPLVGPVLSGGRPDVIHVHWLESLTTGSTRLRTALKGARLLPELLLVKLLGVTLVWTVHNLSSHDGTYPRWERAWRIVLPNLFFDHLIVHCERAEEMVREAYRLDRSTPVTVIPHGNYVGQYPRDVSREQAREAFSLEADSTVFAFFGEIRPYKGVPSFLEAFDRLEDDRARLLVAGPPRTEALRRTIADWAEPRDDAHADLRFIPDGEVARWFEAADAIVLPYRDVLTSGSGVLALSFARPVIVPAIGCLPELVEDGVTGFVYDPGDPDGLERALERALASDLAGMGRAGYEEMTGRGWDRIAGRTRAVYVSDRPFSRS